ncbi:hypothetical protein RD792_012965 [Penstemon davidsonii]|uniref:RING-type E3 ubiquitin transferase (cysteine targeting) n=1 Tax=Penstemon davidsonii TaxID=160366 RepID=A0ABR0CYP0_9LAMI|nr:hypothetical protein RD792_012965 [Penstemon davidsonii]
MLIVYVSAYTFVVRMGLEGPGLTVSQKIWYCIATVGGQYIWGRLQSFSAFRRWGDTEQRSLARRSWFVLQRIEGFYKAASFGNLLLFLLTGRVTMDPHFNFRHLHVSQITPKARSVREISLNPLFWQYRVSVEMRISLVEEKRQPWMGTFLIHQILEDLEGRNIDAAFELHHLYSSPMKILTWNCQGAGGDNFRTNFRELVKIHHPDIVYLLETKVSETRAEVISNSLGFSGVCRAPIDGRSGGIWLLWQKENIRVEVLSVDPQVIHAIIGPNSQREWLCSGVYARPNPAVRESLWKNLEDLSTAVRLPWMLTGDFNQVISSNEKKGGCLPSLGRCLRFKEMIDNCGLIDLGFRGPKFTWWNSREGMARIRERIDRSMVNTDWQRLFPNSLVIHLPRTHSDHHPILTLCDGTPQSGKPFRFELAWTTDPSCGEIVKNIWQSSKNIFEAIGFLPSVLRDWNRHVFGNIFERKRILLARINGIQKRLCLRDNNFLSELESTLIGEYNTVLSQEELLWYQKSRVQWGENRVKREITALLTIGRTNDLGRYLGVPIIHERVSPRLFRGVVDRVAKRLSAWKAKLLSLAGRTTLIKSVTSSIPNHVMQSAWLPETTCAQLDKLNRNFLWSSDITQRKLHLVGWNKVTKHKDFGGLGIKQARKTNIALLAKVGWKTLKKENSLWGDTFHKKYLKDNNLLDYNTKAGDSHTWKGVVRSLKELNLCIRWRLGNGKNISVWDDLWVGEEPIGTKMAGHICEEEKNLRVSNLINPNGVWDKSRLRTHIPADIWGTILSIPIPRERDKEDGQVWDGTSNGRFSCNSAYYHLMRMENQNVGTTKDWKWIWKTTCSERVRFFLWTCSHNSLLTNSMRFRRNLTASDTCQRCNNHEESIVHALRDCPWAREVWEFIIAPTQFLKFQQIDADSWIKDNVTKVRFDNIILPYAPWYMVFIATVWMIWKSRNKYIFQNVRDPVKQTVFAIKCLVGDMERIPAKKGKRKLGKPSLVSWSKPLKGWHKLNTDGSVLESKNCAAAGGLIRDDTGSWVVGFSRKLGSTSITMAELLAAREGLEMAWEMRLQRLELELDSEVVFSLIKDADVETHPLGNIIKDCRTLIRMPWECRIVHTRRSGNGCADALAKMGHDLDTSLCSWDIAPQNATKHSQRLVKDFIKVKELVDWLASRIWLHFSNGISYTHRYRSLIERALRARLVYGSPNMNRAVSFEYMNRQLVWNEFSEMLLLLLPLLNSSSVKKILRPFSKDKSLNSEEDEALCPICQATPNTPFLALPCTAITVFEHGVLQLWRSGVPGAMNLLSLCNDVGVLSKMLHNDICFTRGGGEEDKFGGSIFEQQKKLENWEDQVLLNLSSPPAPAISYTTSSSRFDVKQEALAAAAAAAAGSQILQNQHLYHHAHNPSTKTTSSITITNNFSAGGKTTTPPLLEGKINNHHHHHSSETDTASVLSESIGCIRILQAQIEALSSPYMRHASESTGHHQHSEIHLISSLSYNAKHFGFFFHDWVVLRFELSFSVLPQFDAIFYHFLCFRMGLEGPGLTVSQKIWYCIATVGGQYIWGRLQSFSAFRRWGDTEQRSLARRSWFVLQRIEGFYKAASFGNLLLFLLTGRELVKVHNPDIVYLLETKVSETRAEVISNSLGFSGVCREPIDGRSGGIWLVWEKGNIRVEVLSVDPQVIHAISGPNSQREWLCSGVYARPNPAVKRSLWKNLEDLSTAVRLPWMLTGDFNQVISSNEKKGGCLPSLGRCLRFKEMIDNCGLIDLGFRGPKFTWWNSREGMARIRERIDRSMVNTDWQRLFPNSLVIHLPRTHSDHHPILTLCDGTPQSGDNNFLSELESTLIGEYNTVLSQEELLWYQKSRVQWSKVFFAQRGENRVKREITALLTIGRTNDLGRYLGVPIIHERVSPRLFRGVVDRVAKRLSAWKAKLLSLAGRTTLIKSVTSSIPNHVMQSAWLPETTCAQLDKLNRNFLWSSDITQRKLHLVGWNKVTKHKDFGGLGIKQARKTNIALLAKVGWKTLKKENSLWGDTFHKKYLKDNNLLDYNTKAGDSHTWKGVVRSLKELNLCIRWRLGNGKNISVWDDLWVGEEPIGTKMAGHICEEEKNLRVSNLINPNGVWDKSRLRTHIPADIWGTILSIPIPRERDKEDGQVWDGTSNGWHKLNTDGSVLESKNCTAAGGLIRDDTGSWVVGFSRKLDSTSITMAELLAAREGLEMAWEMRLQRLELELDSEVVFSLIKDADVETHPLGNIIKDCRTLIRMPWECRIVHTRRSGNGCADALAKMGHDLDTSLCSWDIAPQNATKHSQRLVKDFIKVKELVDWLASRIWLHFSNGISYTHRYRSLIERALRARLVYGSPNMNRAVSFEYMNRQLVWNEFSEMLLLLLPLLNSSSVKKILRPFSKDKSLNSEEDEALCPICQATPNTPFLALPCQHRYCYYCLRTRCSATLAFRCSRGGGEEDKFGGSIFEQQKKLENWEDQVLLNLSSPPAPAISYTTSSSRFDVKQEALAAAAAAAGSQILQNQHLYHHAHNPSTKTTSSITITNNFSAGGKTTTPPLLEGKINNHHHHHSSETDTASVLSESIGCIRILQAQIEALSSPYMRHASESTGHHQHSDSLEGQGAKNLRSLGLCLVPISFIQLVGDDNGADYWAPPATLGGSF